MWNGDPEILVVIPRVKYQFSGLVTARVPSGQELEDWTELSTTTASANEVGVELFRRRQGSAVGLRIVGVTPGSMWATPGNSRVLHSGSRTFERVHR